MPRGQGRGRPHAPIVSASSTLSALLTILQNQGRTYRAISKQTGFGVNAPNRWARGFGAPNILTVEALAEVLGYEIILRKKQNGQSQSSENAEFRREDFPEPTASAPAPPLYHAIRGTRGRFVRREV